MCKRLSDCHCQIVKPGDQREQVATCDRLPQWTGKQLLIGEVTSSNRWPQQNTILWNERTEIALCWCCNLRAEDTHRLERVTKIASRTIGLDVKNLHSVFESAVLSKLRAIMLDSTHPLHYKVVINRSGRIRPPCTNTKRFRLSSLPNFKR